VIIASVTGSDRYHRLFADLELLRTVLDGPRHHSFPQSSKLGVGLLIRSGRKTILDKLYVWCRRCVEAIRWHDRWWQALKKVLGDSFRIEHVLQLITMNRIGELRQI
jgi:hypothetical protein